MTVSGFNEKCSMAMPVGSSMSTVFLRARSAETAAPPARFFIGWEIRQAAILSLGLAFPRSTSISVGECRDCAARRATGRHSAYAVS